MSRKCGRKKKIDRVLSSDLGFSILAFHPFKVLVDVCLCKLHLAARVLLIVADFSLLPQVIQR